MVQGILKPKQKPYEHVRLGHIPNKLHTQIEVRCGQISSLATTAHNECYPLN